MDTVMHIADQAAWFMTVWSACYTIGYYVIAPLLFDDDGGW